MPSDRTGAQRHRVVIVGGGFGGLTAALKLRDAPVDVTLVDRRNHQLFQPLLYQVASGAIGEGECASPIRSALRRNDNTTVLMAEATGVDAEKRQLLLERGPPLNYDSLIVACGSETSYFGHEEWANVSCGLKTLADAVDLRNRFYGAFEEAERFDNPTDRAEWMTFVVIGGGPTGVEIAGQLAVITRHQLRRDFRRVDPREARVILLDAGDRLLPAFSEKLSAKATRAIQKLGVTVREGVRATSVDERGVTLQTADGSERVAARTVIWAAGVRPASFTAMVARATGVSTDRGGRIPVGPGLAVAGHPEISVIGDVALLDGSDGKPLPGLATVAIQQAHHVATAIKKGEPGATAPFRYFDKGALAVVGRGKAVCEIRGLQLSGRPAFFTYLFVHLYYLGKGIPARRLGVLIDWISARVGRLQSRVVEGELASVERLRSGAKGT